MSRALIDDDSLPAALTVTGGEETEGTVVGPTGVLVGPAVMVPVWVPVADAVMGVTPERMVLGGGCETITVVLGSCDTATGVLDGAETTTVVLDPIDTITVVISCGDDDVVLGNSVAEVLLTAGGGGGKVDTLVTGGGVEMVSVHGQLVMVSVIDEVTV